MRSNRCTYHMFVVTTFDKTTPIDIIISIGVVTDILFGNTGALRWRNK